MPQLARVPLRSVMGHKSASAILLCLPISILVVALIAYPMSYAIYLSMLNKAETQFVGLDNFAYLLGREAFWQVVYQSLLFTFVAVIFKCVLGVIAALLVHNLPGTQHRGLRVILLLPWAMPMALATLGWWWLFEPTQGGLNWLMDQFLGLRISWLSETWSARFAVLLVNIWAGTPFFMIMVLAGLKSVPGELYDAAIIDGANARQRFVYVTLPVIRPVISITVLFSIIVTISNFDIVQTLTGGGPRNSTHMFATYSYRAGIMSNDLPLGAAIALFMFPILAIVSILILRRIRRDAQGL